MYVQRANVCGSKEGVNEKDPKLNIMYSLLSKICWKNEPFMLKMNISVLDKMLNYTYSAQMRADQNKVLVKKIQI